MANDADTSGLLPFICSVAGTTSQPAMCDFGVLDPGSGRRQGDEGIGGYYKPAYTLGNSIHMLHVMPRRFGTHRSACIAQLSHQNPELLGASPKRGPKLGQGDGGISEHCKVGHHLRDSHHMLSVMPRCWGYHGSSWIER